MAGTAGHSLADTRNGGRWPADSTDGARLRLEVRMKPEIRAAADKELPPDHAPIRVRPAARRRRRVRRHQRRYEGGRGFFTRDQLGAIIGVDLAGRLFNRIPTDSP